MRKIQIVFFISTVRSRLQALSIMRTALIAVLFILGLVSVALGQSRHTQNTLKLDDQNIRPKATIESVSWLVGSWKGEAFGGTFEEVWTEASSSTMVGMFKLMHNNKPTMYEFELIVEEKGSLTVQLKHFNADLSGWEEKDQFISFPLVKLTENAAYFEGLTYLRDGPDRLKVYVVVGQDGVVREEAMLFHRM